ncbi:leucine carboxyl methyltransferase 1 homolog [Octopus sinensis]|uniref:Leucine carboxyl methyltransferase 1 homolog n=1 Tax=Octopus sinensis TaxID=2607531 RepID=A0A6P7TUG0_9MOLL|nr:leucine carboxyl methyltransferase 1 homolog [Octopus sinensis]
MNQVQKTNDTSTISKSSCAVRGFFNDPYIPLFIKRYRNRCPAINQRDHFHSTGAPLYGLSKYPSIESQRERFLSLVGIELLTRNLTNLKE